MNNIGVHHWPKQSHLYWSFLESCGPSVWDIIVTVAVVEKQSFDWSLKLHSSAKLYFNTPGVPVRNLTQRILVLGSPEQRQ